jgi:hypothetical protein
MSLATLPQQSPPDAADWFEIVLDDERQAEDLYECLQQAKCPEYLMRTDDGALFVVRWHW